jgi:GNAT superfamily N-acetyltransferase
MNCRFATVHDARLLAAMNYQLIRDEGHRNTMSLDQLEERMTEWLQGAYQAVLFEEESESAGYALFRQELEWIHLRQFFVRAEFRRQGIGTAAMQWLFQNPWKDALRIRLEVLIGNTKAAAFWRSLGFAEYCVTMEKPMR